MKKKSNIIQLFGELFSVQSRGTQGDIWALEISTGRVLHIFGFKA